MSTFIFRTGLFAFFLATNTILSLKAQNSSVTVISGVVKDADTQSGIVADVAFVTGNKYTTVSSDDGHYSVTIPSSGKYELMLTARGYFSEHTDLKNIDMRELEMNFKMRPIKEGVVIKMNNVLFHQGTTSLLSESFPELDRIAKFLKENPTVEIELRGHTDNAGDTTLNWQLSMHRVKVIRRYFSSRGVSRERIQLKWFGGRHPICVGTDPECHRLNRRVEFLVLKK